MSFLQMSFAGAVMILVITVIRALTINRLPKKTFLAFWGITLVRLFIPFSLPSIFSVYSLFGKSTQRMDAADNTAAVLIPNVPTEQVTATAETITETATSISVWAVIWAVVCWSAPFSLHLPTGNACGNFEPPCQWRTISQNVGSQSIRSSGLSLSDSPTVFLLL